ncbi:MAG: glycosyltransferase family 2 protein [Nitrospirae bacterium]|nr:glycosyltransferase family 2 protein [Nitrospirota bacterium]MCL5421605.1 glycosyltransferase family 2 protein [Nitrospirota bacterium]
MHSDTLIIIPAYNEEKTILKVITSIKEQYPDMDVAVINDGSSDNTARLAREAGAMVLSHPFNMGYGVSLQTGYKYAVRNHYSFLVQIDADGQHDPGGIGTLLALVKNGTAHIALGSRFLGPGEYQPSIYRLTGIKVFRLLLRLLSGEKISDVTTGFQAMDRKVMNVFVRDFFPCDYPDADVIMLLSKLKFTIKEAPVRMYSSPSGKSMHRSPVRAFYYTFKMVLSMILTKLRKYSLPNRDDSSKKVEG